MERSNDGGDMVVMDRQGRLDRFQPYSNRFVVRRECAGIIDSAYRSESSQHIWDHSGCIFCHKLDDKLTSVLAGHFLKSSLK